MSIVDLIESMQIRRDWQEKFDSGIRNSAVVVKYVEGSVIAICLGYQPSLFLAQHPRLRISIIFTDLPAVTPGFGRENPDVFELLYEIE